MKTGRMILFRMSLVSLLCAVVTLAACGDDEGTDPTPDPTADMNPDVMPDPDPTMNPDVMPDPEPEMNPDVMPDPEPEMNPDPEPEDFPVIDCETDLASPPDGTCGVEAGEGSLVIRGIILGTEAVFEGGEVLVDGEGTIVCAGCDCSDAEGREGATVVTCAEGVVSPGLINAHDHITFTQNAPADWGDERYEHRHDWRRGIRGHSRIGGVEGRASNDEIAWGELRQLMGGTTSVTGSGGGGGFLRNLDRGNLQEGLGQGEVELDTFALGDSGGELRSNSCNYPGLPDSSVLGEDSWSPHVSEGIDAEARNEFLCISSAANGGVDVTEDNGAFIHSVGLLAVDGRELAANGTSVVWSPRSNISLYGHTAQVTMLDRLGVLLAIGTDWTPSGSINIQRELACADYLNTNHYNGYFSDRELWLMATNNGAQALAVDDALGTIRPGLVADLAVFALGDAGNPYRAVIDANVGETVLVLRGGEPLYGDESVMGAIPNLAEGCEVMPESVCEVSKTLCVNSEIGKGFDALAQSNRGSYQLFACEVPPLEPTCVPSRPGEFDGEVTEEDLDGDGLANELDNCPLVFNPVRPVDGEAQSDHDNDGLGDVCDPCPVDPDTEDCTRPDPADSDADGILNVQDNCPSDANPEQDDFDQDGKGDVCDPCPEDFNAGNAGCPFSIYDIKTGTVGEGQRIVTQGVVSALASPRFFLQVPDNARDEVQGAAFSGIFVFIPGDNPDMIEIPEVGDLVEIEATVSDFFGQLQLTFPTNIEVVETGVDAPTPEEVQPAEVATDGELADDFEGVLVRTECEVESLNPPAGPGDADPTNEYVCIGGLRVNDLMHVTDPFPLVGDVLEVTGVLRFANQDSKLEPRDEGDIRFIRTAPPRLVSFAPEQAFVEAGETPTDTFPSLTIRLDRPPLEGGAEVSLSSANPEALAVPESVVFAEGQREATVQVTGLQAGADPIDVTASLDDDSLVVGVIVLDPERVPVLDAFAPESVTVAIGFAAEVRVRLTEPAPADGAIVTLGTDPGGLIELPETVTIPAQAIEAVFQITGAEAGTLTLSATLGDSLVEAAVEVIETPPLGLVISEVYYDAPGGDDGFEWVEIFNGTSSAIDLSTHSLGSGGNGYNTLVIQLDGVLEPGQCFVVGGPTSDDSNGNPTFDQVLNFEPDIQNSGDTADAIGIFDVTAESITDSSVPLDAVIYGGDNSNGFVDEEGEVGAVDVGDAPSGQTIERTADGWIIQTSPSPNDCSPLF